jgi:hypothetical protein
MRRIPVPTQSRDECLRRAAELEWLAENCRDARAHAELLDKARLWRSLALRAPVDRPA